MIEIRIFYLIGAHLLFGRVLSLTINICQTGELTKQINCGENSLIRVERAMAVYNFPLVCGEHVIGLGGNPPVNCRVEDEEIFRRCYGREKCDIKPRDSEVLIAGCATSYATNYLLIEYSCLAVPVFVRIHVPVTTDTSGATLDVFTPGFPDSIPPGEQQFSCIVTTTNVQQKSFTLKIKKNILILNDSSKTCEETLIFTDGENLLKSHCNFQEDWNKEETYQIKDSFSLTYKSNSSTKYNGRFWFSLSGTDSDGKAVNLKISNPDHKSNLKNEDETKDESDNALLFGIIGALVGAVLVAVVVTIFVLLKKRRRSPSDGFIEDIHRSRNSVGTEYTDVTVDYVNTSPVNPPRYDNAPLRPYNNTVPAANSANTVIEDYEFVSQAGAGGTSNCAYQSDGAYENLSVESRETCDESKKVYKTLNVK